MTLQDLTFPWTILQTITNWSDKVTDREHLSLNLLATFLSSFLSTRYIRFMHPLHRVQFFLILFPLSHFPVLLLTRFFFSSSLIATWKIDSRTVTHSAQKDPSWEMTVTGRRARIRLEIGSLVGRTMKQWDCYVRGRKDEGPRALERSPFVHSRVHRWNFSLDCEF